MRKLLLVALLGAMVMPLTGCVLAPQTIRLNEEVVQDNGPRLDRDALVRVVDERDLGIDVIGNRGGRAPEYSPVLSDKPLADVLTTRMQATLAGLGFGGNSTKDPLKVQLAVEKFEYHCNKGFIVNECGMEMRFQVTVIDGDKTFTKPYGINEMRSLAASPVAEYNQKWVNDVLERLWLFMFNDKELKQALGVF